MATTITLLSGQRTPLIGLVRRSSVVVVSLTESKTIPIEFGPEVMRDLTIVSPDALQEQIRIVCSQYFANETGLILVLSPEVYFKQDFPGKQHYQAFEDTEVLHFFDLVPFENIVKKVMKTTEGVTAIAVNKDLYQPLFDAFAQMGISAFSLVPWFVLFDDDQSNTFDAAQARDVARNMDKVKTHNLLSELHGFGGGEAHQTTPTPAHKSSPPSAATKMTMGSPVTTGGGPRLVMDMAITPNVLKLAAVFGLLILVLVLLLVLQSRGAI